MKTILNENLVIHYDSGRFLDWLDNFYINRKSILEKVSISKASLTYPWHPILKMEG